MKVSRNRLGFWQGYFNRKRAFQWRWARKLNARGGWWRPKGHKSARWRFIQKGIEYASRKWF